ncbi:hypothetical protein GV054_09035 [Marinomonas mediterranea]|uniref:hypothetical protein n=1 Tax=Marinomonas mediterranea TaxID=119864 RepID=UPI00234B5755|nr:hypothetical protein [Marinomonas mediterranea]WCN13140.1 hypothetical protein GV054_09035 [Marinomonas mediterranea]
MRDLFNEFPDTEAAYLEVANNAHDLARWKPSHEVLYEAGRRVGFSKIRRRDTGAGKRAFGKIYKEVCKAHMRGERFPRSVIEPQNTGEKLTASEVFTRRQIGRERIGDIRAILEG